MNFRGGAAILEEGQLFIETMTSHHITSPPGSVRNQSKTEAKYIHFPLAQEITKFCQKAVEKAMN